MLPHVPAPAGERPARADRWWFGAAVVVQLVVLYWPFGLGDPGTSGVDKLVHAAVFGAVALAGRRVGIPLVPLALALVAHAVVSEVVQGALLRGRSADLWDMVADGAGTVLGLVAARTVSARRLAVRRRNAR